MSHVDSSNDLLVVDIVVVNLVSAQQLVEQRSNFSNCSIFLVFDFVHLSTMYGKFALNRIPSSPYQFSISIPLSKAFDAYPSRFSKGTPTGKRFFL